MLFHLKQINFHKLQYLYEKDKDSNKNLLFVKGSGDLIRIF
jgi:hypothetical protein